jgi:pectinesterase
MKKNIFDAIVDINYKGNAGEIVDGIKTYSSISRVLSDVPETNTVPFIIFVKNGRYYEKIEVRKPFISFIGEKSDKTIIYHDTASGTKKPDGSTFTTWGSATLTIARNNFYAENITIENSFDFPNNEKKEDNDPTKLADKQAVAVKTEYGSDKVVFKNCRILGYQDTLFANYGRQYYKDCYIGGHVDFIFGSGQAIFDKCEIISRDRSKIPNGYIVAPSTDISQKYGFTFINCKLKKEFDDMEKGSVYLGRPWHPTTRFEGDVRKADIDAVGASVFINCFMDDHIAVDGWTSMHGKDKDGNQINFFPDKDARFFEYGSTGPGAILNDSRKQLSSKEVNEYTIEKIFDGWNLLV